ncbi:MAG: hypothetical protein ACO2ZP_04985 [Bacteriovoracaceae bacterium]
MDLVWARYKNEPRRAFKAVIDDLIGNSRYTPTLNDFNEHFVASSMGEPDGCASCDYTGRVIKNVTEQCPVTLQNRTYRYAYRCTCELGETFKSHSYVAF